MFEKEIVIAENIHDFLKGKNMKFKKYSQLGLYILKVKDEYRSDTKCCRGLIYDMKNNTIIFRPPQHTIEIEHSEVEEDDIIEELYDGTMINMFYNNNEWKMSTRSSIGCNNRWGEKSFRELFDQMKQFSNDDLDKEFTYSFVLRSTQNPCIMPVEHDEIILVECMKDSKIMNVQDHIENRMIDVKVPQIYFKSEYRKLFQGKKGFIIKRNDERYKILSNQYKKRKEYQRNDNNPKSVFYDLMNEWKLKDYLVVFPEKRREYNNYLNELNNCVENVYNSYCSVYIQKKNQMKDIEFQYKPLIIELHKKYLNEDKKIKYRTVKDYIYNLPKNKLLFVLQY